MMNIDAINPGTNSAPLLSSISDSDSLTKTTIGNKRKRPHSEIANMSMKPCLPLITLPIDAATLLQNEINVDNCQQHQPTVILPTPSSSSASLLAMNMERVDNNKHVISSPQEYFKAMLQSRGYPGTNFCSLKCGYHNSPTVSVW